MNTKSLSSSGRTLVGKCLCGAVQVSIADEFIYAGYCHCPDCRASSCSAFSALAGIRKEKLQLTCDEESISKFRKNEDNVIYFCRHCGSWLFSVVRNGEFAHVRLGILIYDPSIRPTFHIFVGSKAPWDTICDGLPQFAGLPDDGCASEYSASLGRRSCVSILLMEEKLGLAEDDFLAQLEIKCSLLTSQTRFCIGPFCPRWCACRSH